MLFYKPKPAIEQEMSIKVNKNLIYHKWLSLLQMIVKLTTCKLLWCNRFGFDLIYFVLFVCLLVCLFVLLVCLSVCLSFLFAPNDELKPLKLSIKTLFAKLIMRDIRFASFWYSIETSLELWQCWWWDAWRFQG